MQVPLNTRPVLDRARTNTKAFLADTRAAIGRERPYYSVGEIAMYLLTLIGEIPVILARFLVFSMIVTIVMLIKGDTNASPDLLWIVLAPTMWSVLALIVPVGGGWWWRTRSGGRQPSSREQLAYKDAIELLQANSPTPLPLPESWFVIDTPHPDAAVAGSTLMLSRGLLETDHVPAVLAHELGHLGTSDGRLTAALNRLVIFTNPFMHIASGEDAGHARPKDHWITQTREAHKRWQGPSEEMESVVDVIYGFLKIMFFVSLFAKGGLGLWLTKPAWGQYWRAREYTADEYAAGLGQADELADFLEVHALIHDHPIPFMWLTEHTHPPTELRIDKMRNAALGNSTAALSTSDQMAGSGPQRTLAA